MGSSGQQPLNDGGVGDVVGRGIGTAHGRGRREGCRAQVPRDGGRVCIERDLLQAWEVGSSPPMSVRGATCYMRTRFAVGDVQGVV